MDTLADVLKFEMREYIAGFRDGRNGLDPESITDGYRMGFRAGLAEREEQEVAA